MLQSGNGNPYDLYRKHGRIEVAIVEKVSKIRWL